MDSDPARALWLINRPTQRSAWTRRGFLGIGLATTAAGLLAACGAPAPSAAPTTAPAAQASKPTQSTGELKMAIDAEFPATLDASSCALAWPKPLLA